MVDLTKENLKGLTQTLWDSNLK